MKRFGREYPSAVRCFADDFEAWIAHLECPASHRKVVRTTNLLERPFVEERRRSRAAGVVPGERAVLKLMYAAMARASETWRGIRITELDRRRLEDLRQKLALRHAKETAPAVKGPKPPSRVYSRTGT